MIVRVPPNWSKWREPVNTASELPTQGECGEIRVVLDTKEIYLYDCEAGSWQSVGQVGIGSGTDKGAVYFQDGELKVASNVIIDDTAQKISVHVVETTSIQGLVGIDTTGMSIGGNVTINGNVGISGSLSVSGTKNAAVLIRSDPASGERIPTAALEAPFMSGIYHVDTVTATPEGTLLELPQEFLETIDPKTLKVFITPRANSIVWYEPDGEEIRVFADPEAEVDVLVWGRRWDVEVIEDVRKSVWRDKHGGS